MSEIKNQYVSLSETDFERTSEYKFWKVSVQIYLGLHFFLTRLCLTHTGILNLHIFFRLLNYTNTTVYCNAATKSFFDDLR